MPSGSKKRKATMKKKETKAKNNHSPTNCQGNNDLKTQNEKESGSCEVSSPTYQEYHNPLTEKQDKEEEEEEKKRVSCSVGSVVFADKNPMEGSENGGNGKGEIAWRVEVEVEKVVQFVMELEPDEGSESTSVSVEPVEELGDRSFSQDADESPLVEKNPSTVESPVEPVVSLPKEVTQVSEVPPIKNIGTSDLINSESKIIKDKIPLLNENAGALGVIDTVLPLSDDNAGASGVTDLVLKENEDEVLPSSDAPVSVGTSNGGEHHKDYETPESSVNQPLLESTSPTVQPTSWKSCCGLFDVLRGSNR